MLGEYITAHHLTIAAVVLLILIAGYTDYRKRLIENKLTLPAIAIGFLLNTVGNGWQGILLSFTGLLVGGGLFLIPYKFGRLGAGDVKLMAAVGALLGGYPAFNVALYTAIAGGVLALSTSALNNNLHSTINRVGQLMSGGLRRNQLMERPTGVQFDGTIPYGLAIGAGTVCFLVMGAIV